MRYINWPCHPFIASSLGLLTGRLTAVKPSTLSARIGSPVCLVFVLSLICPASAVGPVDLWATTALVLRTFLHQWQYEGGAAANSELEGHVNKMKGTYH